jgi:methanogenic corrinoid protein MtbC1
MDARKNSSGRFESALLALDRLESERILMDTGDGRSPIMRVEQDVVPAMESIGRLWEEGKISLSQVYMSGRICEDLVKKLLPANSGGAKRSGKAALVVLEDRHLLGKRMVAASLSASGRSVNDYGCMDADSLVQRTIADGVEILLISTLMLHSALRVAKVREGLVRAGRPVRIVVGGAPFRLDGELWREVGADAMGRNASDAVRLLEALSGGGDR